MPNRRISKKEQDIHFSKRTGTKKRQKKIKKLNKKEIALQIKNEMEVKRYYKYNYDELILFKVWISMKEGS